MIRSLIRYFLVDDDRLKIVPVDESRFPACVMRHNGGTSMHVVWHDLAKPTQMRHIRRRGQD